jgi:hypothetical protein
MKELSNPGRRALLRRAVLGLSLAPLVLGESSPAAAPAQLPLVSEQDPAAKALHYVADASRAKAASSGAECSNCSLYSAADGAAQGSCSLFPGKLVTAAGWCSSWSGL